MYELSPARPPSPPRSTPFASAPLGASEACAASFTRISTCPARRTGRSRGLFLGSIWSDEVGTLWMGTFPVDLPCTNGHAGYHVLCSIQGSSVGSQFVRAFSHAKQTTRSGALGVGEAKKPAAASLSGVKELPECGHVARLNDAKRCISCSIM